MRLVIDLQGAQSSGSRNRGIGRYSQSLTKAIINTKGKHEVFIVLNGLFPDTIEPIRDAFDDLLPQENILVWMTPGPVNANSPQNDKRRRISELIREQFLASLSPDIVLVSSLFEGFIDDAVTSIGSFSKSLTTAVILYDLIPLIHRSIYLQDSVIASWYKEKADHLQRADLLLSISASSGQEAVEHLGFDSRNIVNISTAAEEHFTPSPVSIAMRKHLADHYGMMKSIVLYTGGIDHRKNIEGLINAYALLSDELRHSHQLAVVCAIQQADRERLLKLAKDVGLTQNELILTGFVTEEELLACYRICELFVFPSWHEGFGLPALEAMKCGKAVIASNTSSLPEVLECEEALFNPFDTSAIAKKLTQALSDHGFRMDLERRGLEQARKFSWEASAIRTWQAIENHITHAKKHAPMLNNIPRLAYVSPLPPEASGISDYSAELLPALARYYRIEVIVAQNWVSDPWIRANCAIHDIAWFRQYAHEFDRVLYHFGNSPFHNHMFELLRIQPGVVVLHDFFLSGIVRHREFTGDKPNGWNDALLESHGWSAIYNRYHTQFEDEVVEKFPCNLQILEEALGVIVHAKYSQQLAINWYGNINEANWRLIPLLKKSVDSIDRKEARRRLGVAENEFIVCSFGLIGPYKLNRRLLTAWLDSPLSKNSQCRLVFVGQNHSGEYGAQLMNEIRMAKGKSRIEITGWAEPTIFRQWLAAADVGVQLRTSSRGETSAAVLDCMNYGLATIVNANGSMAELPQDAVWMLSDQFDDSDLIHALKTLHIDRKRLNDLSNKALQFIKERHDPSLCSAKYAEAIEGYYRQASYGMPGLLKAIATQNSVLHSSEWPMLASCIAKNNPPKMKRRQLLVDISVLVQTDAKSGIQRVVRSILYHWMLNQPTGWQIEPVYTTGDSDRYRYARRFTSRFLGAPDDWASDDEVETFPGDEYLGLDLLHFIVNKHVAILQDWHRRGVGIRFVVYDLLPILKQEVFPEGLKDMHHRWLETVAQFDGAVCISRAVADELQHWLEAFGPKRKRPFSLQWFHLGADVENSVPSYGIPPNAIKVLASLRSRISFLSVGTIEPRKGQGQLLSAIEAIWAHGADVNLVLVGKQGWTVDALAERFRSHEEIGKRLFWLQGISDEYLEKIYASSSCLIAASEGEGFGLPLIEAAQHRLPIIARDIPVFREVAGEHAFYFTDDKNPQILANAIESWLALNSSDIAPQSRSMPWLTWKQSAEMLLDCVLGNTKVYKIWTFNKE